MDLDDAADALGRLRMVKPYQPLTLLWAIQRAAAGHPRLARWSNVRTDLEAALVQESGRDDHPAASAEFPVLALRDSPLWEIRVDYPVPPAHGSTASRWMHQQDPEFGLSAPAFDLARDARTRPGFITAVRRLLGEREESASGYERDWDLEPGAVLPRQDVHARYGGNRQSGIARSGSTPNVLVFTDPESGRQHGYFDGWGNDGCFHYTGEGQQGDQRMIRGNKALLKHREDGKALRLFRSVGGAVQYVGPFVVDDNRPWYASEAPETGGGPMRMVIVFRLRPAGPVRNFDAPLPITLEATSRVDHIAVETRKAEEFDVQARAEPTTALRREARLVEDYAEYLRSSGHAVCRLRIVPPGDLRPLFTDLFDETAQELIEAKGTVTREAIRMAVGQLLDYRRFLDSATNLALLVPSAPRGDLVDLCQTVGIKVVWPDEGWTSV